MFNRYSNHFHLMCVILFLSSESGRALYFNFSGFSRSQQGECSPGNGTICFLGDAHLGDGVIQLTVNLEDKNFSNSLGSAYYSEPIRLWDNSTGELTNFTTSFSLAIKPASNSGGMADGIAFFLSPFPYHAPISNGGFLGLVSDAYKYNTSELVAVEFDSYPNTGGLYNWDPPFQHIGIDINSINSTEYAELYPGSRIGDISGIATVSYDSSTQKLRVRFFDAVNQSRVVSLSHAVDLRKILPQWVAVGFSGSTGSPWFQFNRILRWEFNSTLNIVPENNSTLDQGMRSRRTRARLLGGIAAGTGLFVVVASVVSISLWKRCNSWRTSTAGAEFVTDAQQELSIDCEIENDKGPRRFPYGQLAAATSNFSDDRRLGLGGFGTVYRGFLRDLNLDLAVKRFSKDSKQGAKEFISEVNIISQLRHRNLVQLIGWWHERAELLLVYEFMPNGSLDAHLFGEKPLLPWPARYNIALGLVSALVYLHTECQQCVVHRDIKSSNVMLDADFNAKLGDFGLARLINHTSGMKTTAMAGTPGYMAPEFFLFTGEVGKESDVYSFGVVLLEIACGRRPIDLAAADELTAKLVDWVWELYGNDRILQAADPRLEGEYDEVQIERLMLVGLWCANPDLKARPSMKQAMAALNFGLAAMPSLPRSMPVLLYSSNACWGVEEVPLVSAESFVASTTAVHGSWLQEARDE